ncbi:MAG TPA: hypothetical protein DEV93_10060 [Chloroflexi bacterium]|jgi:hypothetical protein|nr:hypothetical protein [Chloroflexota bacterium]
MAFYRKQEALLTLEPDIAVIPECAKEIKVSGGSSVWVGSIRSKGLAVLAYGDYGVSIDKAYEPGIQWVAPVNVTGPHSFFLLAIWGQRPYGEGVQTALEAYHKQLSTRPSVVAGDFNQNSKWDRPNRARNHTRTVDLLESIGLASAYHHHYGVTHGAERHSTHYWRNQAETEPGFHIDFCFIPKGWLRRINALEVGSYAQWIASGLSDHVPLVVDVSVPYAR